MNEVTTRQPRPLDKFKDNLRRMKESGDLDMLPSNVSYDAFRNAAIVAVQDNPSILQCQPDTVFKAIRRLAAAGLVPDGQEAAIVPFKGQAQAMPMVRGLLRVARNSGEVISIWSEVVFEGEDFRIRIEDGERRFEHDYDPMNRGSGAIKGAYAVAKLRDGTIELETMGREQIEKRRRASANQKGDQATGIWAQWPDEMAKKTVIRALCKRLPMSSDDLRRLMVEDEANEVRLRDVTPEPEAPRKNAAQLIREKAEQVPEIDLSDAFPGSDEYDEGLKAFQSGAEAASCPYADGEQRIDWMGGYRAAEGAQEAEQ